MKAIRLSRLRRWLPTVPEDGTVGLVVGLHWTRWLRFWIGAPLLLVACWGLVSGVWHLTAASGTAGIGRWIALGALCVLALKGTFLWYRAFRAMCVVVTRATLYRSRIEKWFWRVADPIPINGGRFESHIEGWGLFGVRTLLFTLEGDLPEVELRHSNLGADGMRRIHALTSPVTLLDYASSNAIMKIDKSLGGA